jgi:hypothetical protein
MITKFYKSLAAGTVTSLLLATLAVAPVSAQSSGNGQGSGQNQGQSQAQNQGQGSCAAFAQSIGQGMNQSNSQNAQNGNNNNNGNNGNNSQNGNNGQAALGTGTGNAATPMANCWLLIGPGQKQWYKFHAGARSSTGDQDNNNNNANGVDDSDAAIVQLTMDTPGCVTFEIWTLARLNAPPPVSSDASSEAKRKDKEIARGPVGVGSPVFAIMDTSEHSSSNNSLSNSSDNNNQNPSVLLWRGGSTVSENFYIAVRNLRSDLTCSYRLSVAGPTVSFPGANNGGNNSANGNTNNGNNGNNNNGSNNSSNNGNNSNG